jgi:hypothetical protein
MAGPTGANAVLTARPAGNWRPVVGYDGLYDVSDQGEIWSWQLWRGTRGRILRGNCDAKGYLRVWLLGRGKRRYRLIHQIVLEAFAGPCPPGHEGRHGRAGGSRTDNRLINLEWGTRADNVADKIRDGTTRLSPDDIAMIRVSREAGWRLREIADEFGVSISAVHGVLSGRNWRST